MTKNNTLPVEWCVRHNNTQQFQDVVNYLNENHCAGYSGNSYGGYYGICNDETCCSDLSWGTILTIEEFKKHINTSPSLPTLPPKWSVMGGEELVLLLKQTKVFNSILEGNINRYYHFDGKTINDYSEDPIYPVVTVEELRNFINAPKIYLKLIKEYPGKELGDIAIFGGGKLIWEKDNEPIPISFHENGWFEQSKNIKVGDWVIIDDPSWDSGIVQIKDIANNKYYCECRSWHINSIYGKLTRLATPEEIENAITLPTIKGYEGKYEDDKIKYGCVEIDKKWVVNVVENLSKFVNKPILNIEISKCVIPMSEIEKVYKYLKVNKYV